MSTSARRGCMAACVLACLFASGTHAALLPADPPDSKYAFTLPSPYYKVSVFRSGHGRLRIAGTSFVDMVPLNLRFTRAGVGTMNQGDQWDSIAANIETEGQTRVLTLKGQLNSLAVEETVTFRDDFIDMRWRGTVGGIAPDTDIKRIHFYSRVYYPDIPYTLTTADGRRLEGRRLQDADPVSGVSRLQTVFKQHEITLSALEAEDMRVEEGVLTIIPKGYDGTLRPGQVLTCRVSVQVTPRPTAAADETEPEPATLSSSGTDHSDDVKQAAGLSQLADASGLDNPTKRWNANLIHVNEPVDREHELPYDYATQIEGDTWDFDERDFEGIAAFSPGIRDQEVSEGCLRFAVETDDAYFYWGSHQEHDGNRGLTIAANWPLPQFNALHWYVRIRLKQSLPETTWTVASRRGCSGGGIEKSAATVKGTDWQTVEFRMSRPFWYMAGPHQPTRRCSVAVQPGDLAGNHVEIDWVRVICPRNSMTFRYRFDLPKPVRRARLCLPLERAPELYINGRQLPTPFPPHLIGGSIVQDYDCTEFLNRGENVLAFRDDVRAGGRDTVLRRNTQGSFFLEAFVEFEDGTFTRLVTDDQWKGTFRIVEDWFDPELDDASWPDVVSEGNVADQRGLLLTGSDSRSGRQADPPYLGPIRVLMRHPRKDGLHLFQEDQGLDVDIVFPRQNSGEGGCRLEYELVNTLRRATVARGALEPPETDDRLARFPLQLQAPAGPYDLVLKGFHGDSILDRRYYELIMLGRIPQNSWPLGQVEENMRKKHITTIECGDPDDPHDFVDGFATFKRWKVSSETGSSRLSEINGVRVRETGDKLADWFSYHFDIEHPWRPHQVVVEYLDDRWQQFDVRINEARKDGKYKNIPIGRNGRLCRMNPAVYAGGPLYPPAGKLQELAFLYWPMFDEATVTVLNAARGGRRTAIHRIHVYEVEDLPAVQVPYRQSRYFGCSSEHGVYTLLETFFAGEDAGKATFIYGPWRFRYHGAYRNWYVTFANLIRYMRYAGQNMMSPGIWMYTNAEYPSALQWHGYMTTQFDSWAILFEMFSANDLALLPGCEFMDMLTQRGTVMDRFTDDEVRAGASPVVAVSRENQQVSATASSGNRIPIPYHQDYVSIVQDVTEEIVERYGHYKAFQGLSLVSVTGYWGPSYYLGSASARPGEPSPRWTDVVFHNSYDDATMALFEKESGLDLPVADDDPERFRKRFEWIVDHCREPWTEFRCRRLAEVYDTLGKCIEAAAPGRKCYLFYGVLPDYVKYFAGLPEDAFRARLRECGLAPELLKQAGGLGVGTHHYLDYKCTSLPRGLARCFYRSSYLDRFFSDAGGDCAFVRQAFYEIPVKIPKGVDWLWRVTDDNPVAMPAHRYYASDYAARLVNQTPEVIVFGSNDGPINTGDDVYQRGFAVPFQSIPAGKYTTLRGRGMGCNVVIRVHRQGADRGFYVLNPAWWKLDVTLTFDRATVLHDRVSGRKVNTADKVLRLHLPPHGLRPFTCDVAGAAPVACDTHVAEEGRRYVEERDALADVFLESGLGVSPDMLMIDATIPELRDVVTHMCRLVDEERYATALRTLHEPNVIKLMDYLVKRRDAGKVEPLALYRVNLGCSTPYTDSGGRDWLPDQSCEYGTRPYGYTHTGGRGLHRPDSVVIHDTKDPLIYRTERTCFEGYIFRVAPGRYTVRLHYVEAASRPVPGRKDTGVLINGKLAVPGFVIADEAGGIHRPLVKDIHNVSPENGKILIESEDEQRGRLSGIEILPET